MKKIKDLWAGMSEVEYRGKSLEMKKFRKYMAEELMVIPGDVYVARSGEQVEQRGWAKVHSAKPLVDGSAHGLHPGTKSWGEIDPQTKISANSPKMAYCVLRGKPQMLGHGQ